MKINNDINIFSLLREFIKSGLEYNLFKSQNEG